MYKSSYIMNYYYTKMQCYGYLCVYIIDIEQSAKFHNCLDYAKKKFKFS